MVGTQPSTDWLATDALLKYFDKKRTVAIFDYIYFIEQGINKKIWDDLQHQIFLGDDEFVEKHQLMQEQLEGDLSEIPFKQRSVTPLSFILLHIVKAYQLGGYAMKEIGNYFKIHYPVVSRIIAVSKNKIMQNETIWWY
jgi:hypothetical protein